MQHALEQIPSADVKVYVVWEPILPWDREGAAKENRGLVTDRRASHFWARDLELAKRFQGPIRLEGEPAWDVYLLYDSEASWSGESVPVPADFMHQLAGRLPDDKMLDEPALTRHIMKLVHEAHE